MTDCGGNHMPCNRDPPKGARIGAIHDKLLLANREMRPFVHRRELED